MDPKIQAEFEEYCSERRVQLAMELRNLGALLERCESPLEQRFLVGALRKFQARAYIGTSPGPGDWKGPSLWGSFHDPDLERFAVRIWPQKMIRSLEKNYRADFVFRVICWEMEAGGYEEYCRIVVEVDGHDFHEKTKQQAQRDKARDRHIIAAGFPVLRFTGSEVYRNAEGVVEEIYQLLYKRAREVAETRGS